MHSKEVNYSNNGKNIAVPEWLVVCLTVVLILSLLSALAWWHVERAETVVSIEVVGAALNAQFIDGTTEDKTRVETDRGVYLVFGTFQITKGEMLEIQERKSYDRLLCKTGKQECWNLVK